jgi:hypothetical protein
MTSISSTQTTAAVRASSNTRQAGFAPPIPDSFDPPMLGQRGLQQSDVGSYTAHGNHDSAGLTYEGTAQSDDSGKKKVPFKEQVIGMLHSPNLELARLTEPYHFKASPR